jgi:hypothetical protein
MKKRSPADHDIFQHEENLLHKFTESNSAYIKFSSQYIDIPTCPVGKEQEMFKVGDIVGTTECATFKQGYRWKILQVYKQNGYWQHTAQMIPTAEEVKKKIKGTITNFRQKDIILIERPVDPKTTKRQPRAKKAK